MTTFHQFCPAAQLYIISVFRSIDMILFTGPALVCGNIFLDVGTAVIGSISANKNDCTTVVKLLLNTTTYLYILCTLSYLSATCSTQVDLHPCRLTGGTPHSQSNTALQLHYYVILAWFILLRSTHVVRSTQNRTEDFPLSPPPPRRYIQHLACVT